MSRKGVRIKKRKVQDLKYNDRLVGKFVNQLMLDGKKSVAEKVFYSALDHIAEKKGEDGLKLFKKAIDQVKPVLEVRSRRVGGANYQVPVEVRPERKLSLAIRWLVNYSRQRSEKGMHLRLAGEFLDVLENRGGSMKKREDVHRMAEANRAFAHFRW